MTTSTDPKPDEPHEDGRAALLLPPTPPPPGTIRLLIARGCTWTVRDAPGTTQIDLTLTPARPRRRPQGGRP